MRASNEPALAMELGRRRPRSTSLILVGLVLALIGVMVVAMTIGAAGIPLSRLVVAFDLSGTASVQSERDRLILWAIRLPRIVLASIVGALLGLAGTLMQGLFRNPLADPALIGVSAGAGFAAASVIVAGDRVLAETGLRLPFGALPVAAFFGALAATSLVYRLSTREGHTSIATALLTGLALGALASAGTGLLVYAADDRQLRDITFWTLGSLTGATWPKVAAVAPFLIVLLLMSPFIARGLDLLVLGETDAFHAGVPVQRLKRITILLAAAAAGAAVAASGVVGFVGIVVPHLLRLLIGPAHRLLLPAAACFGALVLLTADTFARTVVAPAELPIGIVTALIGAPFFLFLVRRQMFLGP